ncbi:hypothetical protein [Rhodococcus sp. AH-ZY2]|uniref:DUF3846 domain-containing protein n=1 Tax=Rhodococcus sp. AH-ZY2 TaxID=3047468 RepID=UPI0027E05188|nr:hypothetical protein [Rhodococcus sp. AH-ZY2]WML66158.1 hypothetical protein QNA09_26995 [Rhodococcus sp. AH-ZY2]
MDKMVTAVRVDVDGTAAVIELAGTEERGVGAALRAALDCRMFDVVRIGPGLDMWIDEEGLLVGEPLSPALRAGERAGRCAPRSGAAARLGGGPVTLPSPASLRSAQ